MAREQSDFKNSLQLTPLGDDLSARIARLEAIIKLLSQALLGGEQPGGRGVARATTRVGQASEVVEHLPDPVLLSQLLDEYRSTPATLSPPPDLNSSQ